MNRRLWFGVAWVIASALPVLPTQAWSTLTVVPVAVALAIFQALVLHTFVEKRLFWLWFWATAPLVAIAPAVGYAAGFTVFFVVAGLASVIASFAASQPPGEPLVLVALALGLVAGGVPAVVGQYLALDKRLGRRWLFTIPVPGLTYGLAVIALSDPGAAAYRIAVTLVYGVLTAIALLPLVGQRISDNP